jgi:hypothetical protein
MVNALIHFMVVCLQFTVKGYNKMLTCMFCLFLDTRTLYPLYIAIHGL